MSAIDVPDILPNAPGYRVDEVHMWIGVHVDGSEAILSADLQLTHSDGMPVRRHMALMNSRRDVAESLAGIARRIQREAMHRADKMIRVELRTFRAVR